MDLLKIRGRKPFAEANIEEFKAATKHIDFSGYTKTAAYEEYVSWADGLNMKAVSSITFNKFFDGFNGMGNPQSLKKIILPLNVQFMALDKYVSLVTDGVLKSLYVHGEPGIGKTVTVKQTLEKLNTNYSYFNGGVKGSFELAKILYENRKGKVIVFDDFDSVFKSKTQIDLLKIALDDKESRNITWVDGTKRNKGDKIPQTFEFTSSVIFISNRTRIDPAIKSRCKIMNFVTSKEEILDFIHSKFDTFITNIPLNYKEEVYQYMKSNISDFDRIDFRKFKNVIVDRLAMPENWKKMISSNTL